MKSFWLAMLVSLPLALHAGNDISKVNGSIRVTAGEAVGDVSTVNGPIRVEERVTARNVETVNGSITIERHAQVGAIDTVNGSVSLGENAKATAVETVNGKLELAEGAQVSGSVSAVNGTALLSKGADIAGKLSNVNGKMTIVGAHVGGGLNTTTGDIDIGPDSHIEGGILVEKPGFNLLNSRKRKPRIVIGPGAIVEGTLKFEHEVELYVSDRARIGPVQGAEPVMFSGEKP